MSEVEGGGNSNCHPEAEDAMTEFDEGIGVGASSTPIQRGRSGVKGGLSMFVKKFSRVSREKIGHGDKLTLLLASIGIGIMLPMGIGFSLSRIGQNGKNGVVPPGLQTAEMLLWGVSAFPLLVVCYRLAMAAIDRGDDWTAEDLKDWREALRAPTGVSLVGLSLLIEEIAYGSSNASLPKGIITAILQVMGLTALFQVPASWSLSRNVRLHQPHTRGRKKAPWIATAGVALVGGLFAFLSYGAARTPRSNQLPEDGTAFCYSGKEVLAAEDAYASATTTIVRHSGQAAKKSSTSAPTAANTAASSPVTLPPFSNGGPPLTANPTSQDYAAPIRCFDSPIRQPAKVTVTVTRP